VRHLLIAAEETPEFRSRGEAKAENGFQGVKISGPRSRPCAFSISSFASSLCHNELDSLLILALSNRPV